MRSLVFGGAGFLGSHLVEQLALLAHEIVVVDDLSSGCTENIQNLVIGGAVSFINQDICDPISVPGKFDFVFNLASPASPPRYSLLQRQTLRTGSIGTLNAVEFALKKDARFIQASTSEIYGDPTVHPQSEDYWGNVNPIGPRSCYDESKRFSEALCFAYHNECNLDLGIARIFNTYGPRLNSLDGRVVSNLICQALLNEPMSVFGDGNQTRSFCFVSDLISGLLKLAFSEFTGPYNLGNPNEISINELTQMIKSLTGSNSHIEYHGLPVDDPNRRRPDITKAKTDLGWTPEIDLNLGLQKTIDYFSSVGYPNR